jgi:hypothetical protein
MQAPRIPPPADATLAPYTLTAAQTGIVFSPAEAQIGNVIHLEGFGWPDGELSIYLIPYDESELDVIFPLIESGGLFVVARASVSNGLFSVQFEVPSELVSENGERRRSVRAERYKVGAQTSNGLRSSGPLTIKGP